MSQEVGGPAQGTRSRKTSGLPRALQKVNLQGQTLVSQYVSFAKPDESQLSITSKKRSQSGKVYQTSLEITPNNTKNKMSDINEHDNEYDQRHVQSTVKGDCDDCDPQNNQRESASTVFTHTITSIVTTNSNISANTITVSATTPSVSVIASHPQDHRHQSSPSPINGQHPHLPSTSSNMENGQNGGESAIMAMLQSMSTQLTTIQTDIASLKE